jgi:hypothetical protein
MNRLRDMDGDGPLFRRGVELIARTPAAAKVPDVKLRVWRALQRAPVAAPRGLRILAVKLAMVAIVALGAGTAGAVIARRWIGPERDSTAAPRPSTPSRPRAEAAPPTIPAITPVAEPAVASRAPRPPARSAPRRAATAPPSAAAIARERTEVLDALVALRREHDPARAGTLLARYLSAHPHGAMREEAIVLAIEAADARGDRAAGAQLAHAYQAEFPAGRFLPFARSHTEGHARQ